ncbi:restriction endonuclease subunit S [Niallia taxi]|uniref:restriction endonuclease subunit S n=1 Tax=Niallia taxi TaxID=2499688 RepID=UPI0021A5D0D3|nr:restriction endonuclease subunit S [Niallia taxi]MCT2346573.1 restriction endonuclease subunit S [Niallia taxi]
MSKVTLKEIADIQTGPFGTQLHKSEYVPQGIMMLNAKNIGKGEILTDSVDFVSEEVCERLPKYVLKEGDILFGRAGSIEKHTYVSGEYEGSFQGTNCIRIRCKSAELSKYIAYYLWLPQVKRTIENNTGGSIQSYISSDRLKDIVVDIPDERTIHSTVKILSTIDSKIQNNNKVNDNLQQQAALLYDYWFTQFDFPDANGNPYKASGGLMVRDKLLKHEIPVGWTVKSLINNPLVTILKPGVDVFDRKTYLATAEVNGTSITTGNIVEYATRESRANMQPTVNSVWFAKMKNSIKHLFLNEEMLPLINSSILSTGFCGLQCTEKSFEYISSFIGYSYFETIKNTLAHGATQEAVNNKDLDGIFMVIPDDKTLSLYHEATKCIYAKISKNMCENQELVRLKDWLLPMLMNGQVTVTD